MTTKEMIEVMQAYEDGKTIECKQKGQCDSMWIVVRSPDWNWYYYDYRVKAEPIYRQYFTKEELLKDLQERHYNYHNVWLKSKIDGTLSMITEYSDKRVMFGSHYLTFSNTFENYTFEDGTPFGIKEN